MGLFKIYNDGLGLRTSNIVLSALIERPDVLSDFRAGY